MTHDLLINVVPGEIRAALVDDGRLVELFAERRRSASLVSNIYLGRVDRIVPGMNAAFVDIGIGRSGFLTADAARTGWTETDAAPAIGDLMTEGAAALVQVVKDAMGRKGVQLNRRITLPGRYLVYSPERPRLALSRMIDSEAEQSRLLSLMEDIVEPGEGFIVRTNAAGAGAGELAADAAYLRRLWNDVEAARDQMQAPSLVHADLDPLLRLFRDHVHDGVSRILIDNDAGLAAARSFCARFISELEPKLELYRGSEPVFSLHDVEDEIARALTARVGLPSGGTIVIEATEALTAVDVNSGSFVDGATPRETAHRTNLEAAAEIARQIRLRNIGGLVIVDFIHMDDGECWDDILAEVDSRLRQDRTPSRIVGRTESGLVEITRRRRRDSLAQIMTETCGACGGAGRVPSVWSVSHDLMRAVLREAAVAPPGPLTVCASHDVVDALENGAAEDLAELRAAVGRHVNFRREPGYGREQFDIVVETGH